MRASQRRRPNLKLTCYGGAGGKLRHQRPAIGKAIRRAIDTESGRSILAI